MIGFDPGYDRLGWAVIDATNRTEPVALDYGCITTDKTGTIYQRYQAILLELESIIERHKPQAAALESLFFNTNVTTAMRVSEVRGLIFSAVLPTDCTIAEYTPSQIKQAVTGFGRADKAAVTKMVMLQLKIKSEPQYDDTVDALAVAFTHSLVYKQTTV